MHATAPPAQDRSLRPGFQSKLAHAASRVRDAVFTPSPLHLWLVNAAALVLLAGWIVMDARFTETWNHLEYEVGLAGDGSKLDQYMRGFQRWRIFALGTVVALSSASLGLLTFGLTLGKRGHRALSSWMAALSLSCLWLGLIAGWEDLSWLGKRLRLDSHVAAFEPIAQSLQDAWPLVDGERPHLGPFMAYPTGRPKTLILLTRPPVAEQGPSFSSVERSEHGGLRFQLSGKERGVWLERHPQYEEPASFTGGLLEPHTLKRSVSLGDGWYLVRYEVAAIAS